MKLNKSLLYIVTVLSASFLQAGQADLTEIKEHLIRGSDANNFVAYTDQYGCRNKGLPLHVAAQYGDVELTKLALEKGAYMVNVKDAHQYTPLRWATTGNHEKVAEILMKNGVDIKSKDSKLSIMSAVEDGYIQVLKVLLDNDMSANTIINNVSVLRTACVFGFAKIVSLLIEKGADVNYESQGRLEALPALNDTIEALCENKEPEKVNEYITIVNLLLRHGAEVNKGACIEKGICTWNLLDKAFGHYGPMKLLLLHGIKPTEDFLNKLALKINELNLNLKQLKNNDYESQVGWLEVSNEISLWEEIHTIIKIQTKNEKLEELIKAQKEQINLIKEKNELLLKPSDIQWT